MPQCRELVLRLIYVNGIAIIYYRSKISVYIYTYVRFMTKILNTNFAFKNMHSKINFICIQAPLPPPQKKKRDKRRSKIKQQHDNKHVLIIANNNSANSKQRRFHPLQRKYNFLIDSQNYRRVIGPKKIGVFPLTCRKKLGSVGRKIFLFFYKFLFNKIRSKIFLWVTFH